MSEYRYKKLEVVVSSLEDWIRKGLPMDLPKDLKVVSIFLQDGGETFEVILSSKEFEEVENIRLIPHLLTASRV